MHGLKVGHKYGLRPLEDVVRWWRWGIKEDNLEPAGSRPYDCTLGESETPAPLVMEFEGEGERIELVFAVEE